MVKNTVRPTWILWLLGIWLIGWLVNLTVVCVCLNLTVCVFFLKNVLVIRWYDVFVFCLISSELVPEAMDLHPWSRMISMVKSPSESPDILIGVMDSPILGWGDAVHVNFLMHEVGLYRLFWWMCFLAVDKNHMIFQFCHSFWVYLFY